jgi:hypothetical protein
LSAKHTQHPAAGAGTGDLGAGRAAGVCRLLANPATLAVAALQQGILGMFDVWAERFGDSTGPLRDI